jgi:hypothetical protein
MLTETTLLLRLYWRLDRRDSSRLPLLARLLSYFGVVVLMWISGFLGYAASQFVRGSDVPIQVNAGLVPGVILTLVWFTTIFVGLNEALKALYLSGDLDRLMVAPIQSSSVMTAKLLSRLPTTLRLTLLLGIPALVIYCIGLGIGPWYYLLGVFLVLVAPLFGLALGALLAMILVRGLPAKRLSEYLSAVYIILGMLAALAFQLPRLLAGGEGINPQSAESVENLLHTLETLPLPTIMAGRGLVDLARGQVLASAWGGIAFYLLITLGLYIVTVLLADRLYLSGWMRMQASGARMQGFEERRGLFGGDSLAITLAIKDWLLRLRDSRQIATLFSGVVFAAVFAFFLLRNQGGGSLLDISQAGDIPPQASWLTAFMSRGVILSGMVLVVAWSMVSNAALSSLALERDSFYILKAAPVSARQVYQAKLLGLVAVYVVVVTVLLAASWILVRFSLVWAIYAWLCLVIIGYGLLAFTVALGCVYPKLDWEDPRRMTTGRARLYNMVGSLVFGLVTVLIALVPFVLAAIAPAGAPLYALLGLLALLAVAWGLVQWTTHRVEKAWPALGEVS